MPMPDTPHSEIEQRLRATAEHRRRDVGGPFELHAVDRRRLQEEVARTHRARPTRDGFSWLAWLRRRRASLALYGGLALIVVLAAPTLLQLPGRDRREQAPLTDSPTTTPTVPLDAAASPIETALPAPSVPPPPEPSTTALSADPAPAVTPPAAAPHAIAERSLVRGGEPGPAQFRSRADQESPLASPRTLSASPPAPLRAGVPNTSSERSAALLQSFRLEQRGEQVAIVDADGSVYHGTANLLEPGSGVPPPPPSPTSPAPARDAAATTTSPALARSARRSALPGEGEAAAPMLRFQALGTNRTLQQAVLITGTLPGTTNLTGQTQQWIRVVTPTPDQPTTNLPLSGQLQIGRESPVPFQAHPAAR